MASTRGVKDYIIGAIAVVVLLGFLSFALIRTADLYYKAGWIVAHFPPKGAVCTEMFCLRTDTTKPEAKMMQVHFAYCGQHLSSGFQARGGRSTGILIYLALFMFVFSFVSVPVFGAL